MGERVTMETYLNWSPLGREEFDLWLSHTTGLEVGSSFVFEVYITEDFIVTWHYLNWGDGIVASPAKPKTPYFFKQVFSIADEAWVQAPIELEWEGEFPRHKQE